MGSPSLGTYLTPKNLLRMEKEIIVLNLTYLGIEVVESEVISFI